MKKILVVAHTMGLGGIERSLLGLLKSFDYDKYSVDLFLMRHDGELFDEIPEQVNLLSEIKQCTCYAVPLINVLKKGQVLMGVGRLYSKFKAFKFKKKSNSGKSASCVELEYSHKYTMPFVKALNQKYEYDLAISFATPHYFVRDKVKAKKKVAWIHTDYSTIELDTKSEFEMWKAFDYIAGVSDQCVDSFRNVFPQLADKLIMIENILVSSTVQENANKLIEDNFKFDKSTINLLSVGRFDVAKNFESVPEITSMLIKKGLDVKWYLIGFGATENTIRENINKFDVGENVIILGKKDNPYPFMNECDVYVQPSLFEGKCVAVREAQILGKPVVITRYLTAESQIESGVNGYIIEQGTENIVFGLCELLSQNERLQKVSKYCLEHDFGNSSEINKIYAMVEE